MPACSAEVRKVSTDIEVASTKFEAASIKLSAVSTFTWSAQTSNGVVSTKSGVASAHCGLVSTNSYFGDLFIFSPTLRVVLPACVLEADRMQTSEPNSPNSRLDTNLAE